MKFLDKKSSRFYHRTAKAVALLTLAAIIVPFSLFAPIPAHAAAEDSLGCGISSTLDPAVCLANVVYVFTVGLGSGLAYVSAFILDTTVSLSLNSAAYALSFLSAGWTTARDLANMAFILILVYIAFMIMFQSETAGTMRMLAWVIFIALIINFSFFFTRVVIDASNILAVQFYNSIGVGPNGQTVTMAQTFTATNSDTGTMANAATGAVASVVPDSTLQNTKDLTASIMSALNVQQFFSNQSFKDFSKNSGFGSKFITLSFLYLAMGACYFILAAMFLAVGIKFLMRIVVLWFLIIASPLAFISKAVPNNPQISGWYDKWQHELISHAFYPAFFLFIFFFISSIMSGLNGDGGILGGLANDLGKLSTNDNLGSGTYVASLIAVIAIRLGFVIAALYIALKASEYMGVKGSEVAHRMTSYAFSKTGQLAAAPVGYVGRQTFGRAGTALANSNYLATRAETVPLHLKSTVLGIDRGSKAVGNALGKASYDPRNAPGASILKKGVEKISGGSVNAGSPAAGGFIAQEKANQERTKAAEYEKRIEELKKDTSKLAASINKLSTKDLENVGAKNIERAIGHMEEKTIKAIEASDKFSDKEKSGLRKAWHEQSAHAPLEKAHTSVGNLRVTNDKLASWGIDLASSKAAVGTQHAPITNTVIDAQKASDIKDEAKDHLQKIADRIAEVDGKINDLNGRLNAPGLSATEVAHYDKLLENAQKQKSSFRTQQKLLNDHVKHAENLDSHRSQIPEDAGNAPQAGEFVTR